MQSDLDGSISRAARSILTSENLASLQEEIHRRVESQLTEAINRTRDQAQDIVAGANQSIRELIEREVSATVHSSSIDRRLEDIVPRHFHDIEIGLGQFLGQQIRRANVYLFLGIVIGLSGISIFSVYFFGMPANPNPWMIIPRAGLLLAFEAFAMFFLRLYKASLSEVAFFQNELTTIRSKHAGLHIAVQVAAQHDYKPLMDAVAELLSLDRNSILEKGQSTKNLEEKKIQSKEEVEMLKAASDVVRAARGK